MAIPIYLDYASTTPVDERIIEIMKSFLNFQNKNFGNASIDYHLFGFNARSAVEKARTQIAKLLVCAPEEIIFTSGATESNNLAIKGIAESYKHHGNHIITTLIEHPSILNSCKYLERLGFKVTYLRPNPQGLISIKKLEKAITYKTILVSIHHVNHELGIIQNIKKIGELCNLKKVILHTDATQSVCKLTINVKKFKIDLLSFSGHKIYAPKGIGALYLNSRISLSPQIEGGGQENNLRSGTLPVHQIVALGEACSLISQDRGKEETRLHLLRQYLCSHIKNIKYIRINTSLANSIPNIINISFMQVKKTFIFSLMTKLAVSLGSACSSYDHKSYHVLLALYGPKSWIYNSIRISFGRYTSAEDIVSTIQHIYECLYWDKLQHKLTSS